MADAPLGPGSVLAGRFTLEDLLDESGGARFWRATDRVLARNVAVHVLPDTDPRADALLRAARSSALVSDVRLLRVLDASTAQGVVYVVNEWGVGVSLDRLLVDGPLSARRAAWVVREVAEAIATAHRNGVAHGRLLPENVMVSESGAVKVIGFVVDSVLRQGTEQHLVTGGGPVSGQESDVVNLAGLLYAALVGRWPGTEGSTIAPAPAEHGRPLRPRQVRAGVPRPLDAICERVLNAGSHPQMLPIRTAHEIYAALSDYIGDPGASVAVPHGATALGSSAEATALLRRPPAGATAVGPTTRAAQVDPADQETSDLPATPAAGGSGVDPEATQVGAPMFLDTDTGRDRLSAEQARATDAPPPGPPPGPPPAPRWRPLFADEPADPAESTDPAESRDPAGSTDPADAANPAGTGEHRPGPAGSRGAPPSGPTAPAEPPRRGARDDGGAFAGEQRSTGTGEGSVPHAWGPDLDRPAPGDGSRWPGGSAPHRPGRGWLRLAVLLAVVVLVVVAAIVAANLRSNPDAGAGPAPGPSTSPSASAPSAARVPVAGVSDFDPLADPAEENPDLAPLAVDGSPRTAWRTVIYRGNPRLGGLKSGVGLLVDLGRATRVGGVRVRLVGSPTSLEVLTAPGATTAPTGLDGLTRSGTAPGAGVEADVRLAKPVTTRWLVVWLTSLPAARGGYQGQVADILVRS